MTLKIIVLENIINEIIRQLTNWKEIFAPYHKRPIYLIYKELLTSMQNDKKTL